MEPFTPVKLKLFFLSPACNSAARYADTIPTVLFSSPAAQCVHQIVAAESQGEDQSAEGLAASGCVDAPNVSLETSPRPSPSVGESAKPSWNGNKALPCS